jgi:hypothetical protein
VTSHPCAGGASCHCRPPFMSGCIPPGRLTVHFVGERRPSSPHCCRSVRYSGALSAVPTSLSPLRTGVWSPGCCQLPSELTALPRRASCRPPPERCTPTRAHRSCSSLRQAVVRLSSVSHASAPFLLSSAAPVRPLLLPCAGSNRASRFASFVAIPSLHRAGASLAAAPPPLVQSVRRRCTSAPRAPDQAHALASQLGRHAVQMVCASDSTHEAVVSFLFSE